MASWWRSEHHVLHQHTRGIETRTTCEGVARMATRADAREAESADVDVCERKGEAWPRRHTLTKGAAGIEFAGGAEKATAAEPEAREPGAYSKT